MRSISSCHCLWSDTCTEKNVSLLTLTFVTLHKRCRKICHLQGNARCYELGSTLQNPGRGQLSTSAMSLYQQLLATMAANTPAVLAASAAKPTSKKTP